MIKVHHVKKRHSRHALSHGFSKRHFTKHALRVHHHNVRPNPMRGGFRL